MGFTVAAVQLEYIRYPQRENVGSMAEYTYLCSIAPLFMLRKQTQLHLSFCL